MGSEQVDEAVQPDGGLPMPWTVLIPDDAGSYREADLEHGAPLPRIGDAVEYFDESGTRHWYRVADVVHIIQSAASTRPLVRDGGGSPNTTPRLGAEPEPPASSGLVRAGLPRVYLTPADDDATAASAISR